MASYVQRRDKSRPYAFTFLHQAYSVSVLAERCATCAMEKAILTYLYYFSHRPSRKDLNDDHNRGWVSLKVLTT